MIDSTEEITNIEVDIVLIGSFTSSPGRQSSRRGTRFLAPAG